MSLVSQINSVLTRIGTEFKSLRTVTGDPADLTTSDKTSLVNAINEAFAAGGGTGSTNLTATLSATNTIIASDTGTDATIPAADGTNAGVMTPAMFTKLGGIEAGADVTDAANVDAAGAVMNSDTTVAAMQFVINESNFASNSATKVPTQQSTKTYVDTAIAGLVASAPGALDTLDELAAALGDDPNFASTITTALGNRLRVDAAQSLTGPQQAQGRSNLSVYSQAEIGDPTTNFVTVFETALA